MSLKSDSGVYENYHSSIRPYITPVVLSYSAHPAIPKVGYWLLLWLSSRSLSTCQISRAITTPQLCNCEVNEATSCGKTFVSVQFQICVLSCACHAAPVHHVFLLPCSAFSLL